MDKERFLEIKNEFILEKRERYGIGTLKEKTVHGILKNYFAPDKDMQEIPINGYVADIYTGKEIFEIQTAHFDKLRNKLESFLQEYPVTVIYPVPHIKWLSWINEETGECSSFRKSPVKGNVYKAFYELYKIKMYLKHPNLRILIVLLDVEEYRLLNGYSQDKKKGSVRYDRIPVELVDEILFERTEDYMQIIPYHLDEEFTVSDFAKEAGIKNKEAQQVMHILHYLNIVKKCGKRGRAYLYMVNE
ncbi:MAG: hypothetical protein J6J79_06170 [Lachnospiraceae bacterium]|nr:hypothetical protein [Lachnospiraceae bacterium]